MDGEPREAATAQEAIAKLFPESSARNTHILRLVPVAEGEARDATKGKPLRLGVVLSGGQAPGGHNVITGIFDYLSRHNPGSTLLGFKNGPRGILKCDYKPLNARELASPIPRRGLRARWLLRLLLSALGLPLCSPLRSRGLAQGACPRTLPRQLTARLPRDHAMQEFYRNQGGFHLICSGRDKIEKPEQLEAGGRTVSPAAMRRGLEG